MPDDLVSVTTLKGFNNGASYAKRNTEIRVTELRARELERNGLITREAKKAPPHENKKAPEPKNKKSPVSNDKVKD